MTKVIWGAIPDRMYEIGVDRGLLAVEGEAIVPWTGLIAITENSTGSDITPIYQNGVRIYNYSLVRSFAATIEAFTYPDEFELALDEDLHPNFHISYRTEIAEVGYKLHLVYKCFVPPASVTYSTISSSLDPTIFSWMIATSPDLEDDGVATSAHFIIDSTEANPDALAQIEDILYGTATTEPRFPTPFEIRYILGGFAPLEIIPAPDTGLADIVTDGRADLAGNMGIGLYKRPPGSRLNDRALGPGLNRLE